ncbi:MAG TPA: alpha/beta hydrolase [Casimicrobiaceae bacterium]|nr:alpha/beta hydrolase [Casimicrobiaceae bacterium]
MTREAPKSAAAPPQGANCSPSGGSAAAEPQAWGDPIYTAELVELGYNNRAAVPEYPRFFELYAEMSRGAVSALGPNLDLRYGPGAKETLDLFVPATRPRGTFVFMHGGYWRSLDKADFSFVASPLVEQGIAVALVNYDLCPFVTIATIVDECRGALLWLLREGPRQGAATDRIVVGGHSAGGHLAAMLFATDWTTYGLSRAPFAGGVTLSGVHDLEPLVLSTMNADLRLDAEEARRVSPVHCAPTSDVPLVVAVGAEETSEFVRQSDLMFDAWPQNRPAGMRGPLRIAGRHHFSVVLDHADAQSAVTRAVLDLF